MPAAQTPAERNIKAAQARATAETLALPDGKLKMQAVNMVMIKRSHTYAGAALRVHASERTVQGWCIAYVRTVAKYAGYL